MLRDLASWVRGRFRRTGNLAQSVDLASLFSFPATWAARTPPRIVIAGGVARSGATYLEAVLQSHPQVLVAQEFMPLKTSLLADFFAYLQICADRERATFTDEAGRHWRDYAASEDPKRMAMLFLTCLLSTTRADVLRDKRPEQIRLVFCKTPGAEFELPKLRAALPSVDFRYVHCVRDPAATLRSTWEMPWQGLEDPSVWAQHLGEAFRVSAESFLAIQAAGIPTHVVCADRLWAASTRRETLSRILQSLELDFDEAPLRQSARRVDPWPQERRRTPPAALTRAHEEEFLAQPGTMRWREVFANDL